MKDLKYYLRLKYPLELRPMEDAEGGWYAHYPDFGLAAAHGDGPTIEAAIREADISKELIIEALLEQGQTPPEPGTDLEAYSGQFRLRVPKYLHRRLVERAEAEGTSLNQLAVSYLSEALARSH